MVSSLKGTWTATNPIPGNDRAGKEEEEEEVYARNWRTWRTCASEERTSVVHTRLYMIRLLGRTQPPDQLFLRGHTPFAAITQTANEPIWVF